MVGRRDDQAMGAVLLDHLEEAVQYPADFAHIIGKPAL